MYLTPLLLTPWYPGTLPLTARLYAWLLVYEVPLIETRVLRPVEDYLNTLTVALLAIGYHLTFFWKLKKIIKMAGSYQVRNLTKFIIYKKVKKLLCSIGMKN